MEGRGEMTGFPLKIVTPDGLRFDGAAQKLIVRTAGGDVAILAKHADYVAPLGMGPAVVETKDRRRYGVCIGGLVSVMHGEATLVATTFEWAEQIDRERAKNAENQAIEQLAGGGLSSPELRLVQARLKRARLRQYVAEQTENKKV